MYQARVPAGAQYVYVMGLPAPSAVRYEQPREGVTVALEGDTAQSQDFILAPSLVQHLEPVHGQVVDEAGKPIADASLNIRRVGEGRITPQDRDLHTDANGAFTLEMTSASAHLRARAHNMATETTTLAQSGENVVLRLKANALLSLTGSVTDGQGRPIAGAKVTLFDWWLGVGMGNVNVTTDAQGHYVFQALYPDARYSVVAEAAGYGTQGSSVTQYKPGERGSVPALLLPRADSFVAGRIVDENGDPVAKQIVNLEGRTNKFQQAVTDAQGHFRFDGVVNEPLHLYLYGDTGFSPPKKAMPFDKDVIIVRKSATPASAANDKNRGEVSHKQQTALLAQPAPELKTVTWLNTKANLPQDIRGKIVLIDFWAISCGPCVASLPEVQKIFEQLAGRGVVVIGLHGSETSRETLAGFIAAHHVSFPIAIDADDPTHQTFGQTMSGYGILGIPTVAVLDRQGVVRYLDSGLEGAMKVIADLLASEK